jgi:putative endonuclease
VRAERATKPRFSTGRLTFAPIASRTGQGGGMPWTYLLQCADGSFYAGSTVDLERRVIQHDLGLGARYTRPRRRRPVQLVWCHETARIDEAFALEKQIQGWSRAKRIALIEGRYDDLPDLASRPPRS